MTQRIVDVFEAVEVDEQQRHLLAAPARQAHRPRKPFLQQHAIG